MGDLLAKVSLGDLLHLAQDHGRNLLRSELLLGAIDLDLDNGLAILVHNLVGEVLKIGLHILLLVLATDKAPNAVSRRSTVSGTWKSLLDVEDGVVRVRGGLVLG